MEPAGKPRGRSAGAADRVARGRLRFERLPIMAASILVLIAA